MNYRELSDHIVALHPFCLTTWTKNSIPLSQTDPLLKLVEENHAFNFQLWNAEDRARRDDQGSDFVYTAKREIDQCNQQRNNRMEAIDEWLFKALAPSQDATCKVHSETPGMMIDRLSILSLKIFHMRLQVNRPAATEEHRIKCKSKLAILVEQHRQLSICLAELLLEVEQHSRTFRVYHQFKMYNDPTLNPELYNPT
jgi:hypothetical protein